jgi:HEAT repeat protein
MTTGRSMRRLILLAVAFVLGVVVMIWFLWQREPVYRGHQLSYWLQGYSPGPFTPKISRAEADEALDAAGTNAIPTLLRLLTAKDPVWKRKLIALSLKPRFFRLHLTSSLHSNAAAVAGFTRLGPEAQRSVPVDDWISVCEQSPSYLSQHFATTALGDLGPAAKSAVPFLLHVAANTNANPAMRASAFEALDRIHAPPELVVPVLMQALHDRSAMVRDSAIDYLGPFGSDAKSAAGALVELLSNPDANLRKLTLQTLEKIDPDLAAKILGEDSGSGK